MLALPNKTAYNRFIFKLFKGFLTMAKLKIFSAPWCCNCKTVKMMLKDTPYETISADEPETAPVYEAYGITSLPTVVAVDDDGREVKRWAGTFNKTIIEEIKTYK